ncbi:MAG: adenylate/guanylate cyclase domain-containing protein [Actinomycetota bacterium]|nr:adenylate/guanylate cyclase domain-containing protein [Actinomycetota bacterium]
MASRGRTRSHALLLAVVGLASAGIAIVFYATGVMHETELNTVDARFAIRGDEDPREDIVLVLIDGVSSQELNLRFPYPRSLHAEVIDAIARDGPKAIAYDVEFLEETEPKEDNALINAVARAGPGKVVLADTQPNEDGESGALGGQDRLEKIGARGANTQVGEDSDGVSRRFPFSVGGLETFPIATAETVEGEQLDEDDMGGKKAWADFAGPPETYPSLSFSRVVNGQVDTGTFRDKIVVVGASDPSLKDVRPTATTDEGLMAGAEFQANSIATALAGFPLQSLPLGGDLVLIGILGLVAPVASYRLSPLRALGLALGVGLLYLVSAQIAFDSGLIVPIVYPLLALVLSLLGSLLVYYVLETVERQRVRDTFARFVPEQVVGEVLSRTDDDLRLGGQRMLVTVMFSDIRSFTTFSETREPEEVLKILNRYHEEMTDAVMEHGGTLISFIGDGIMAVFGAPLAYEDHADRALAAAEEMLAVRLPRFNEWMRERGVGAQFKIGIGVNSGPGMVGNIGSSKRLDYTVIGDTVNTAARLEGMTKGTEHDLFVSDSTRVLLKRELALGFVESMPVRGRAEEIKVWAPSDEVRAESSSPASP